MRFCVGFFKNVDITGKKAFQLDAEMPAFLGAKTLFCPPKEN